MAAEPVKLNLAQKKAIKEAAETSTMKEALEAFSNAMGQPITFEWTAEQTLGAITGVVDESYRERAIKIIYENYLASLATNFKYHCGQDKVFIEELKKLWTTGKITFTVMPKEWQPAATDIAMKSREHGQNGIRIVDGTLDIWCPAEQFYCGPDLLETCEWKMWQLFENVPNDGLTVKAKMDIAKYAEKIAALEKDIKDAGAPAEFKFNPEADYKTVANSKPPEMVNFDRLFQYYEALAWGLKYNGLNDADVKEAILDVWKGQVRVDVVDSLEAVKGTKVANNYNGIMFDGDVLVILIQKDFWACAIDNLGRNEYVKLF